MITHGATVGGKLTRERSSWKAMKERCYYRKNKAFKWYGGRGIQVCDRWHNSFENFLEDMGPCPPGMTLDRKKTNGHYDPGNCRWITQREQTNNSRHNRLLTFQGATMNSTQWARKLGIPEDLVRKRLYRGWSIERVLTQKPRRSPQK